MDNQHNYKFIEGEFSTEEARSLLMALITNKVNFHNLSSFSDYVRFHKDTDKSKKRVTELNETREQILKLIESAKKDGKTLKIKSNISIELI